MAGPDRTGLVDELAAAVKQFEGNWQGSRLSKLAGFVSTLVVVSVPATAAKAFDGPRADGRQIQLWQALAEEAVPSEWKKIHLDVMGPDHPGIVHDVSHALAERQVNILELSSGC